MTMKTGARVASSLVLAALLGGCGGLPTGGDFERIADTPIRERSADANLSAQEAVNFFSEPPVTVLETTRNEGLQLTTDAGQKVPEVPVGQINAAPMEFGALLNQIAEQVGMSWRIVGPGSDELLGKEIYMVQRTETMLSKVLDELSDLTDAFYKVEGDRIIFSQDQLFVLRVPRMADSQEVMADGLRNLGISELFTDRLSGTISFRATRPQYDSARRLISSFEQGRDMVVYDVWIIDRTIGDSAGVGADITISGDDGSEITASGADLISNIASGAAGSGLLSGNLGNIGVDVTVSFLRSLGRTETVARPTISMLSGGESEFKSGTSREYIREINSASDEDGGTSSGTNVQTLETGVTVSVEGSHNGGVISSRFEIEVDEFIEFEEFDTGEITLKLPRTTERQLSAHIEARPGDVMVLGGIIRDREELSSRELGGTGLPTARGREAEKTETILLVRPRLVQIRPAHGAGQAETLRIESGIGSLNLQENPMAAVLEEEARAQALLEKIE